MTRFSARTVGWQVAAILLIATPFLVTGVYVWQKHQWATTALAELEPRYARLLGLSAAKDQLDKAVANANTILRMHVYLADLDVTQTGNLAQQTVRAIFSDSQMGIESIQVLEAKDVGGFQRIEINLRADGNLASLQQALGKLRAQTPTVLINGFSAQSAGVVKPASVQRLNVSLNLSIIKNKS